MGQHVLHGVARLLAGDAQVFLQSTRHGREHRLRCLLGVHRNGGTCTKEADISKGDSQQ